MTELPPILELIPQRPPMVLVDRVVAADAEHARCVLRVEPRAPMLRAGRLPALWTLEAMAQTAAAHLGLLARWAGEPAQGGMLVGIRDVVLECDGFAPGETLEIDARRSFGAERFASYACTVRHAHRVVASATLNVLRQPA